tara:strand:+ start:130 stop:885 length:756 start_codon:yes stop_codon:yes gene_type:complete
MDRRNAINVDDEPGLRELALFAGAGGGILGGRLLGWKTICAVEIDQYAREVLVSRQNDGCLAPFPIWDDICTFNGKPWRGIVDVISGGFPCQDISSAKGPNASGIDGSRSGLWREMARIIREIQPRYLYVENSPMLVCRGLGRVLGDMAAMGYDAEWGVFSAGDVGARHERERIWIIGHIRDSHKKPEKPFSRFYEPSEESIRAMSEGISSKPDMGRKSDGLACWMERLAAIGNGQVPAVARLAWEKLNNG